MILRYSSVFLKIIKLMKNIHISQEWPLKHDSIRCSHLQNTNMTLVLATDISWLIPLYPYIAKFLYSLYRERQCTANYRNIKGCFPPMTVHHVPFTGMELEPFTGQHFETHSTPSRSESSKSIHIRIFFGRKLPISTHIHFLFRKFPFSIHIRQKHRWMKLIKKWQFCIFPINKYKPAIF